MYMSFFNELIFEILYAADKKALKSGFNWIHLELGQKVSKTNSNLIHQMCQLLILRLNNECLFFAVIR